MDNKIIKVQLFDKEPQIDSLKFQLINHVALIKGNAEGLFENNDELKTIQTNREKVKLCFQSLYKNLIEENSKVEEKILTKVMQDREKELQKLILSLENQNEKPKIQPPKNPEEKNFFKKLFSWI